LPTSHTGPGKGWQAAITWSKALTRFVDVGLVDHQVR
jgi:hypothetical protein